MTLLLYDVSRRLISTVKLKGEAEIPSVLNAIEELPERFTMEAPEMKTQNQEDQEDYTRRFKLLMKCDSTATYIETTAKN